MSGTNFSTDPVSRRIYAVCDEADRVGIDALSKAQRAVVLAWAAKGTIDNGGFAYYYAGDWRTVMLAEAFRSFGFEEAARSCEESRLLFPGGIPPEDIDRRSTLLKAIDGELFRPFDKAIFAVSWDALRDAIALYMDARPVEFSRFRTG
jgi:hypothetical protein